MQIPNRGSGLLVETAVPMESLKYSHYPRPSLQFSHVALQPSIHANLPFA